ncbi:hypothetical protein [Thiothrix sp.]|jgi:hypothetical protein|uniref:hypothetical protein n=1 Tax=Thiothrix sp. TaxID=1032 RepID=UPI00257A12AC|nr:hypothetical protein [Thiothrix sp.]
MKTEEELFKSLNLRLKDFKPDDEVNKHWSDPNAGTVIKVKEKPPPYIVFIIFIHLKKYDFGGRWEKVAWEIPIKYKNIPMMLAHKKFGFSIRAFTNKEEHAKLAQEAIYKINKTIPVAEQLIEPLIKSQVDIGAITLANDYNFLRSRYKYFREKAIEHLKKEIYGDDESEKHYEEAIEEYRKSGSIEIDFRVIKGKAASYIAAMTDAYYSLLEHIFVLIRPFIINDKNNIPLSKFIGLNWSDKYKILFDTKDSKAKKQLDVLQKIKEIYRNPLAHGNFRKEGYSLYVHFPRVGTIPMKLTQADSIEYFSFYDTKETELDFICNSFDKFDSFLEEGSAKYGMIYIKRELDVFYDDKNRKRYQAAMNSEKKFGALVEKMIRDSETARNMDW